MTAQRPYFQRRHYQTIAGLITKLRRAETALRKLKKQERYYARRSENSGES